MAFVVRVPLNTASLAVQNLQADGVLKRPDSLSLEEKEEDNAHDIESHALIASLQAVHGVLNDVLDFNRMDAGKLEIVDRPFAFHRSLKSMLGGLNVAAANKDIILEVELDPNIDIVAGAALLAAAGGDPQFPDLKARDSHFDPEATVMGDEMRLRQCVQNVCSNAVKFSLAGGKIRVATKLVWPPVSVQPAAIDEKADGIDDPRRTAELSTVNLQSCSPTDLTHVVVRVEVQDHGVGIAREDVKNARLFSPYVQTEIGRSQGGKGTGLGLALLRQIVKLNDGRLGVQSRKGWVHSSL